MNDPRPAGDLSAAELFRDHAGFVARFLYRLGVPAQAIEDTVQDVFLVVHQRGGYRPGPAKPTTYLALIASHAASAQRRQQRLRAARLGSAQPDEMHAQDDDPAVRVERRDDLHRLQDALSRLDPALRDTLLLAEFEDETAPAIAHAMGVSVGTVYWRLHEARKKFQRALVVADGSRARAAAQRVPDERRASRALARGARLSGIFGLFGGGQGAETLELIRTWRGTSLDFDLTRGLERYVEAVSELPVLPHVASKFSLGAGALQTGAWSGVAACGVLATLQLLSRVPDAAPGDTTQRVRVLQTAAAAERPRATPSTAARVVAEPAPTTIVHGAIAAIPLEPERAVSEPPHNHGAARHGRVHAPSTGRATARGATPQPAPAPREERSAPADDEPAEAPSAPPAQPNRAPSEDHGALLEARALAHAQRLLASSPTRALAIVEELSRTSLREYLSEERQYIQVIALYGVGRRADADRAAERFLSRYRTSVFRDRVLAARKTAASRR